MDGESLVRSRLARIALAAWVNVDPDKLPPEKQWIEHPNHESRKAWDRVVAAILAAAQDLSSTDGEGCLCGGCGKRYRVDLLVRDEVWREINPDGPELLCGGCIAQRIEARGKFDAFWLSAAPPPLLEWREKVARAVLDGFMEGNVAWDEAGEMLQMRCYFAADAVLSVLPPVLGGGGSSSAERAARGPSGLMGSAAQHSAGGQG